MEDLFFAAQVYGSYLYATFFDVVRWTLGTVSVLLLIAFGYVGWRWMQIPPWPKLHEATADAFRKHHAAGSRIGKQWAKIRERLAQPTEAEWKIAVIEADMLVDDVLRRMEYPGESMGERLKGITKDQVTALDNIWDAHKVRNRIVHDPDIRILHRDAREAIANFEVFLREANLID